VDPIGAGGRVGDPSRVTQHPKVPAQHRVLAFHRAVRALQVERPVRAYYENDFSATTNQSFDYVQAANVLAEWSDGTPAKEGHDHQYRHRQQAARTADTLTLLSDNRLARSRGRYPSYAES